MTSFNARQAHNNRTLSPNSTPHFHKRILQDALFDNKLQIPGEFMKKYGENFNTSNPINLKVPSGGEWKVGLIKCDGHVWLGKGWPAFARHHSIKCGHSLFFRFDGRSQFYVVIVDETGSEIDYPILGSTDLESNHKSNENLDRSSPCPKRKEISPPLFPRPNKRMRTQRKLGDGNINGPYNDKRSSKEQVKGGDSRGSKSEEMEGESLMRRKRSLTGDEKTKALDRTKDFTSPKPHFKVVIQRSHLHDRYGMVLPLKFWKKYLKDKVGYEATLNVLEEKTTWPVKFHLRTRHGQKLRSVSFLKRGWQKFAVDNNLEVGNVCIFELIKGNELLFEVSINRDVDYDQNGQVRSQVDESKANPPQSKIHSNERLSTQSSLCGDETSHMPPTELISENDQGETASCFVTPGDLKFGSNSEDGQSSCYEVTHDVPSSSRCNRNFQVATSQLTYKNLYFKVELQESCLHDLHIPDSFSIIRRYFEEERQNVNVKLEVDEKEWFVTMVLTYPSTGQVIFSAGWPEFVRDNDLQPGDFGKFELVSKKTDPMLVFKVIISRRAKVVTS